MYPIASYTHTHTHIYTYCTCITIMWTSVCVTVDSTKSEDVERRLVEAEMMHSSQITVLQQKLQEETEKRYTYILCVCVCVCVHLTFLDNLHVYQVCVI